MAPVTVGNGVTIAAGTTVTRNIADNELVLSRVPQVPQTGLAASGEEEIIWIIAGEIFPANQDERVNIDPRPQAVP